MSTNENFAQELTDAVRTVTGLWLRRVAGRGWCYSITSNGPPGLTSAEQEINRMGGRIFATNRRELIENAIEASKEERFRAEDVEDFDKIKEIDKYVDWLRAVRIP